MHSALTIAIAQVEELFLREPTYRDSTGHIQPMTLDDAADTWAKQHVLDTAQAKSYFDAAVQTDVTPGQLNAPIEANTWQEFYVMVVVQVIAVILRRKLELEFEEQQRVSD